MEHSKLKLHRRGKPKSGVALVIVLMLVVLTTILIVAFSLSVQTETKSMSSAVYGQSSRQLADIAVQSVISQIQQATTQGPKIAWASQPGMIRCYDNSGNATAWYKLYSSSTSVVANPSESLTLVNADLPLTGTSGAWATAGSKNYGVYTDINSPVSSADGSTNYPVVNPAGATSINANPVQGFDIATGKTPGYSPASTTSPVNNPAAMPVRWLYVLQNGAIATPLNGGNGTVTFDPTNPANVPSSSNHIVGRIAYWTDDESCKLNINTAADGGYFDTPRFCSASSDPNLPTITPASTQDTEIVRDRQMAVTPPVAAEYQRYMGHPAQTRLSPVLGSALAGSGMVNRSHLLTLMAPFMQWGGSQAGSVSSYTSLSTANAVTVPTRQTPYATLDEWMFSNQQLVSNNRVPNPGTVAANPPALVTNTNLQQLRFFLSANSDAPEVNLYGQPRICMWPIYTPTLASNALPPLPSIYLTPFDQMIANSATLSPTSTTPFTYYFGRQNAASPTVDWGGTANNTMALLSSSGNTRNQNLFIFLRTLAKNNVPGYGFNFDAKYSSGQMDQILTEIFDYCRSLDPSDLVTAQSGGTYAQTGAGTGGTWGVGQVTPICISQANFGNVYSTQGFGRFDSISDVALDFTQTGIADTANPGNFYMTCLIYVSLYSPAVGYPALDPHLRVVVQSPTSQQNLGMTITTNDGVNHTVFPTLTSPKVFSSIPLQNAPDGGDNGWNNAHDGALLWGGAIGGRQLVINKNSSYSQSPPVAKSTPYMLCGLNMEIPTTCTTFSMPATPLEIKLYHTNVGFSNTTSGDGHDGTAADLVQDITVTFPAFSNLPLPTNSTVGKNAGTPLYTRLWYSGYGPENSPSYYIDKGDVVQSLVSAYNGDTRLVAAQHTINDTVNTGTLGAAPSPAFVAHPLYGLANVPSTGLAMAHAFWDLFPSANARYQMQGYSNPSTLPNGTTGQLVTASTYSPATTANGIPISNQPATGFINPALAGTKNLDPSLTGDWDNGLGHFSDGPFINKADEAGYQYYDNTSTYFNNLYFDGGSANSNTGFDSPNRSAASPVMFGSLPTGVPLGKWTGAGTSAAFTPYGTVQAPLGQAIPWQTLLFRPQPTHYGSNNGGTTIEDEMLLDWFWMPVVDPYSISTTLATAGKVNMNYQIAPFTYITRATALMGVLGSEYVISAPTTGGTTYKTEGKTAYPTYRSPIKVLKSDGVTYDDDAGTLRQFRDRFANGLLFKSAAEICDIYLEPTTDTTGASLSWGAGSTPGDSTSYISAAQTYWGNNQLTGDNSRERPYNGLYSRLTTKSNTYTVHVRAQTLAWPPNATAGQWVENPALITSEYRGAVTINRYLDPQDPNIPDFTASSNLLTYSLDSYYKYRVLETRRFLP